MNKEITQNLLKDHVCQNCENYLYRESERPYCFLRKEKEMVYDRTCTDWIPQGFLIAAITQKDFEEMMAKKEKTFKIDHATTIEGVRLYKADTQELIYDQRFADGPYTFPEAGGSLTLKFAIN